MDLKNTLKKYEFVISLYDYIRENIRKNRIKFSQKKFIEQMYLKKFGKPINLDNPVTFNEKLNWLKLYWHDPLITKCIDKISVRDYVKSCGCEQYLVKLINVYNNIDEVDFEKLPEKFALKMNNGSGCNVLCSNKQLLDVQKIRKEFKREFKRNYYYTYGEWGYKNIVPKIICEELIETSDGKPPKDYKIFCFNGEPEYLFLASDRYDHKTKFDFYTTDWKWLPVKNNHPNAGDIHPKPECLHEMLDIARKLANPFPEVRVDLYYENRKILFGELTFYHFSGFTPFDPMDFDKVLGEKLVLPEIKRI